MQRISDAVESGPYQAIADGGRRTVGKYRRGLRLSRIHAVGLGGTANLAVLGGNLPPSRTHGHVHRLVESLCALLSGW